MSLDYPDREKWLAMRTSSRDPRRFWRWFYIPSQNEGRPYSVGRNAAKRRKRAGK